MLRKSLTIVVLFTFLLTNIGYGLQFDHKQNALRSLALVNAERGRVTITQDLTVTTGHTLKESSAGTNLIEIDRARDALEREVTEFLSSPIARLATEDFELGRKIDTQAGGYINQRGVEPSRSPRYGQTMEEAIRRTDAFAKKHMGEIHQAYDGIVKVFGVGIGGQAACAYQAVGIRNPHPNREMIALDKLGTDYSRYIEEALYLLRRHGRKTPAERLRELKKHWELAKLLMVAGSKSGATDESMANFQLCCQALIEIYSRYVYGDREGRKRANVMIDMIYDGRSWFDEDNDIIKKMSQEEREIFSIVLNRIIVATGEWDDTAQEGGRFDRLRKLFAEKYDAVTYPVTTVWMATNLGGRFQGLSPNGFLYNILMGYDVRAQLEAARAVAVEQLETGDDNRSKRLAAHVRLLGAKKFMIAVPNKSIYGFSQEAFGQLLPESLGKGKMARHEVGLQTYAFTMQEMVDALRYVDDKRGERVYLLISDNMMSEQDKRAEERIIREQTEKGNLVVRYRLKEQNEVELARLLQFMEDFTVWYGQFNVAEAMLNPDKITIPAGVRGSLGVDSALPLAAYNPGKHSLGRIMHGVDTTGEERLLKWVRELYSPYRQPDVEAAKQLLKGSQKDFTDGIAFGMFNQEAVKGSDGLPIRDEDQRREAYREAQQRVKSGPVFKKGSVHLTKKGLYGPQELDIQGLPNIPDDEIKGGTVFLDRAIADLKGAIGEESQKTTELEHQSTVDYRRLSDAAHEEIREILDSINTLVREIGRFDKTAKALALLMLHAREQGKSINMTVYDEVEINLNLLQRFARHIGIERLDFGPKEQHISKQLSSGGIDVGLEVIVETVKKLRDVRAKEGRPVVFDGCVPKYLHGLFSSEVMKGFAWAYAKTFVSRKVESAVLEVKDIADEDGEGIVEMLVILARAQRYFEEMKKVTKASSAGFEDIISGIDVAADSIEYLDELQRSVSAGLGLFYHTKFAELTEETIAGLEGVLSKALEVVGRLNATERMHQEAKIDFRKRVQDYFDAIRIAVNKTSVTNETSEIVGGLARGGLQLHYLAALEMNLLGTIIIDDAKLRGEQGYEVKRHFTKAGDNPLRKMAIEKFGTNIVLSSEFNPEEDWVEGMPILAISAKKIKAAKHIKSVYYLDIDVQGRVDSEIIPADDLLLLARGHLLYLATGQNPEVKNKLVEIYRLATKSQITEDKAVKMIAQFIKKRKISILLPPARPADIDDYDELLKLRILTLIAA